MFTVRATDGGLFAPRVTSVDVDIVIDDVNDNSPVFTRIPYSETISQSASIGSTVLTVRFQTFCLKFVRYTYVRCILFALFFQLLHVHIRQQHVTFVQLA